MYLEVNNYHLPSHGQYLIKNCHTCPDFFYEEHRVAVYIDGPIHDYPDRAQRDKGQAESMEDYGYNVIRFGYKDDWENIISKYPNIFGRNPL